MSEVDEEQGDECAPTADVLEEGAGEGGDETGHLDRVQHFEGRARTPLDEICETRDDLHDCVEDFHDDGEDDEENNLTISRAAFSSTVLSWLIGEECSSEP